MTNSKERKRGFIEVSNQPTLDPTIEMFIEASKRLEGILEKNGVLPITSPSSVENPDLPITPPTITQEDKVH